MTIGSILNPSAGKFSEYTRKKGKGTKTGVSHDWRSFYLSQYDWLKGSHMTKVVWLPIIHTANLWRQMLPIDLEPRQIKLLQSEDDNITCTGRECLPAKYVGN